MDECTGCFETRNSASYIMISHFKFPWSIPTHFPETLPPILTPTTNRNSCGHLSSSFSYARQSASWLHVLRGLLLVVSLHEQLQLPSLLLAFHFRRARPRRPKARLVPMGPRLVLRGHRKRRNLQKRKEAEAEETSCGWLTSLSYFKPHHWVSFHLPVLVWLL